MQVADMLDLLLAHVSFSGELGPSLYCLVDLLDDRLRLTNAEAIGFGQQVSRGEILESPVHRHEVLAGPLPVRVVGKGDVVRRRQLPPPPFQQAEREVLCGRNSSAPMERLPM